MKNSYFLELTSFQKGGKIILKELSPFESVSILHNRFEVMNVRSRTPLQ